jgi:long-chain acyl-CoA synthetase
LNPHIAKFFRNIGLTIAEGYGLTETSPIATVNPAADVRLGTVGKAIPNVTIRLTDEKEVVVQGPNVAMGYWVNGQVEPFREPGTFYTGDLGHLDSDGYLTIIGRAKEIIVLPNGKKINPVVIEQRLELSSGIEQAFVYLDPATKLVACLLVPSVRGLAELADIAGIATVPYETEEFLRRMSSVPEARALVERDLKSHEEHLPEYERVKQWQFAWPAFSEERQELTPTLKLRRFNILKRLEK